MKREDKTRVGKLRPTQLMHTYGVGAMVDLPHISAMVMGTDDWEKERAKEIIEDRLLLAVRGQLGPQVEKLLEPPIAPDDGGGFFSDDDSAKIGVPVAPFPRWLRCPTCSTLAPIRSGLFKFIDDPDFMDRAKYVHINCQKADRPAVVPSRFLVACEKGHLDDFPWIYFVHAGNPCSTPLLKLYEIGVTGEAADIQVTCTTCQAKRRMSEAFGEEGEKSLPKCRGRWPQLREFDANGCGEVMKTLTLGASNAWFAIQKNALSIPVGGDPLFKLVDDHWTTLAKVTAKEALPTARAFVDLSAFAHVTDEVLWAAMEKRRQNTGASEEDPSDLKGPEWRVLYDPDPSKNTPDFELRPVSPPPRYAKLLSRVALAERLREVTALLGFTRIASLYDLASSGDPGERRAPLSRKSPKFVPAGEVRGEGIFIAFDEGPLVAWCGENDALDRELYTAHVEWRKRRRLPNPADNYPGLRYVLLHTFSHALMRQLSLECGYSAASIRERIYARGEMERGGPMAGVLLYTAAPDSEGTLGGLVRLGNPEELGRHIEQALEQMRLCTSDPLCAEHHPDEDGATLHGAACHACLFAPETSCENGNRYLCRETLVHALYRAEVPFFDP